MKILYMPLKKEWYEMIERDEKPEEYREESPYWRRRLIECYGAFGWCDVRGLGGRLCGGCSVGRYSNTSMPCVFRMATPGAG